MGGVSANPLDHACAGSAERTSMNQPVPPTASSNASPRANQLRKTLSGERMKLPFVAVVASGRGDTPLVVGAAVGCPHADGRADRTVAHAVERRTSAAVDDLVAAAADAVEPPLLVVAAVPRCLHGVGAVGRVAPAIGDHAVRTVDDAVVAGAEVDELPLEVGAAVPASPFAHRAGGDVAATVEDQAGRR